MAAKRKKSGWRSMPAEMRTGLVAAVAMFAILILVSQGLINLLLIVFACAVLVVLERTVGDWLTDLVGPVGRALLVALVVLAVGWQLLSSGSRRAAFAAFLGLDTHWLMDRIPTGRLNVPPSSGAPAAAPTSGAVSSSSAAAAAGFSSTKPKGETDPQTSQQAATDRVRMTVVSHGDAAGVRLEARLSGADEIEGVVDFIVDGKQVATSTVGPDGNAVAHVRNLAAGTHRVEARFRGRGALGTASARTTLRTN